MMSGVPLETCWAFNKLWNNKFYYKAASCWYFYWASDSWVGLLSCFYSGKWQTFLLMSAVNCLYLLILLLIHCPVTRRDILWTADYITKYTNKWTGTLFVTALYELKVTENKEAALPNYVTRFLRTLLKDEISPAKLPGIVHKLQLNSCKIISTGDFLRTTVGKYLHHKTGTFCAASTCSTF